MTATLPSEVQQVFERFVTTEYTTIDAKGQAITWPVIPYYRSGDGAIDITTGVGYPKKADDAARNPHVSLLFSDPTGSKIDRPCGVLVQGTAQVDDRDLDANRERYLREAGEKLPRAGGLPPKSMRRMFAWYFNRIYVYVRPERVFVWDGCDFRTEPTLYGSRIEEVRSAHSAEAPVEPPEPEGGPVRWDSRMEELGRRHKTAVLSIVAPDGFPMSCRVPIELDSGAGRVRIPELPGWLPAMPEKACLVAHEHDPDFRWQRNFQIRGDLVRDESGWSLVPHRLVGGLEAPPNAFKRFSSIAPRLLRLRKTAKREMRKRASRG
jgi:hypothetical protein